MILCRVDRSDVKVCTNDVVIKFFTIGTGFREFYPFSSKGISPSSSYFIDYYMDFSRSSLCDTAMATLRNVYHD